jgi:hypothetical protein
MNKLRPILSLCVFALLLTASLNCKKKEGCKDSSAENFDADAKVNCCCTFKGSVVFWYSNNSSIVLQTQGKTSLKFFVDDVEVGTCNTTKYWNAAPECGDAASITVVKELGSDKSKSFDYKVLDQNGSIIWFGTQEWKGKTCAKVELVR